MTEKNTFKGKPIAYLSKREIKELSRRREGRDRRNIRVEWDWERKEEKILSLVRFWLWWQTASSSYTANKTINRKGDATYGMGENICKLYIWLGLISRIYEKLK